MCKYNFMDVYAQGGEVENPQQDLRELQYNNVHCWEEVPYDMSNHISNIAHVSIPQALDV